jgi:diguanylate cyclase (GGDEF)-like protein/putative nucleotidyltransferase with HDIG domain
MRNLVDAVRSPLLKRALLWCCQVYAAVFVLLLLRREGLPFSQAFVFSLAIIPPVFAGACSLSYAKSPVLPRACRIAWRLIGYGGLAFGLGITARLYHHVRSGMPSLPGLADACYLTAYLCLVTAALFLFSPARIPRRGRLLIDSALVFSSISILAWYFLGQRFWYANLSWPVKVLGTGSAFADALLLAAAILLVRGAVGRAAARRNLNQPWLYLSGGMALLAVTDILFASGQLNNQLNNAGSLLNRVGWGWSLGWLLIGYGTHRQLQWPEACEENAALDEPQEAVRPEDAGRWFFSVLAPYLAVAVAFMVVIAHDYSADRAFNNPLFLIGFVLILLVIAGEVLNLLETQRWAVQMRSFNASLEQTVARRTEQLGALHLLTKAINNTLQVDQVLAATLSHTHQALQDDVVLIWLENRALDDRARFHTFPDGALDGRPGARKMLSELPLCRAVETIDLSSFSDSQEGLSDGHCLRAPLQWRGRSSGVIGVVRWDGAFDSTEQAMLESVGLEVGTALENARRFEAAQQAADQDSVTGLLNHRAIHQCLDSEFERLSGQNRSLSIIMMDLDNFKLFNDVHGHPVGDQVLKQVARVLKAECRKFDIVGRYGGDEFIAVLPDTDRETAVEVARHLHERTTQEGFLPPEDNRTIPVTLSFGVAAFPLDSTNRHELLTIADANLYAAKQSEERISSTSEAQHKRRELLSSEGSFDILDAMITAVDNKDRYTRQHSEDVTQYALWLAEELGYSEETMRVTRVGGLLHDVGKIGVPEDILRKPNRLSDIEFEAMKHHPRLGALIIGGVPGMEGIVDAVLYHHERWDGQGYPEGRVGEGIPLLGRILAVADAFSAMTTTRPYRKSLTWEAALEEIKTGAGSQFDPTMAAAFLSAADKHRPDA